MLWERTRKLLIPAMTIGQPLVSSFLFNFVLLLRLPLSTFSMTHSLWSPSSIHSLHMTPLHLCTTVRFTCPLSNTLVKFPNPMVSSSGLNARYLECLIAAWTNRISSSTFFYALITHRRPPNNEFSFLTTKPFL